ncbi:MAG: hypothetical protein OR994_08550 [Candidatus Poseidoniales archaeon]|nr:hypothetical protein [Candidatus Poseidoniales archaeon]
MKLEIRVGVDFGKLATAMPKLIDGFLKSSIDETIKVSKNFIKSGKVTPPLKDITKKTRRRKGFSETPPMYMSHDLYDSIEPTKDGIRLARYGYYHHTGEGNLQREFIMHSLAKDSVKNFVSKMSESLHRKSPLVLKT